MFGTLNSKEIEEVLRHQIIGRIGCHAENMTYVVPISYAYDGVYIYGHTREGMKINLMRKNPMVCFEIDEMKDMANWKSVITWGIFEELNDKTERNKALVSLIDRILPLVSSQTVHLSAHWPFISDDISTIKGIVFRIRPEEKTGRFENNAVADSFAS